MKKLLYTIIFTCIMVFTSCSKKADYTCLCVSSTQETTLTLTDYKEDEAKSLCDQETAEYSSLGGTCTFKRD